MVFVSVYTLIARGRFVATYETALMANYYNGRTETLRSCSTTAAEWVRTFLRTDVTVTMSQYTRQI